MGTFDISRRDTLYLRESQDMRPNRILVNTTYIPGWPRYRRPRLFVASSYCTITRPTSSLKSCYSWALRQDGQRFTYQTSSKLAAGNISSSTSLEDVDARWLRDICNCPLCIDTSTSQKLFQTSDIPLNLKAAISTSSDGTTKITWQNDIVGYPAAHVSTFTKDVLSFSKDRRADELRTASTAWAWTSESLPKQDIFHDFSSYCEKDSILSEVLRNLKLYGLAFLKDVPNDEESVATIANRIGHLRHTFYGRTWDVRSVPQAKNVAYTSQFLGFHMDLLYMTDPPGIQFLHCLKNSCTGGESMFADAFHAAETLRQDDKDSFDTLCQYQQIFHYKNAGQHYYQSRPVIELARDGHTISKVNWSPPFQGPFESNPSFSATFEDYVRAAKKFAAIVEDNASIFERRAEAGECVIFDNRRVLHARREFDTGSGERWLKGAYLDTDVYMSRYRVLAEQMK